MVDPLCLCPLHWKHFVPEYMCIHSVSEETSHTSGKMLFKLNYRNINKYNYLSLKRALLNLYIVHSPTNAPLLSLETFKIYIKIHINIDATYFGLQPSSGILYRAFYIMWRCGSMSWNGVRACRSVTCCHIST